MGEAGRGLFGLYMEAVDPELSPEQVEALWATTPERVKRGWRAVEEHVLSVAGE